MINICDIKTEVTGQPAPVVEAGTGIGQVYTDLQSSSTRVRWRLNSSAGCSAGALQ